MEREEFVQLFREFLERLLVSKLDPYHGEKVVLVGDALRTAHFSIGSGTRLAFEDAIALAQALRDQGGDVPSALQAYETARRPIVEKLVAAANRSAQWYEHFGEHMLLDPWRLAWSYIQRSGRVDVDRLGQVSPRFVAQYEARISNISG